MGIPSEHATLDLSFVRAQFPAINDDFIFMDNAGGSQVLGQTIDRIRDYFLKHNVQLGGSYKRSIVANQKLHAVTDLCAKLINAQRAEEVVIGHSATMLFRILSLCLSENWTAGDEVIVTNTDHEANISCWTDLEKKGIVVKQWKVNPETFEFDITDLEALMTTRTKIVTMAHASNILGTINPIKEIGNVVHEKGALFIVDGVAYAPHRLLDMQEWDVDFYIISCYKIYGPHIGLMYGKYELLKELEGFNHSFIGKDVVPYKLQPGNINYELTYSLKAIPNYLEALYSYHYPQRKSPQRQQWIAAWDLITEQEERLSQCLLDYLNAKEGVRIIGHTSADQHKRVSTIAFVSDKIKSGAINDIVDDFSIGLKHGDFYAKKMIADLGLEEREGVLRVSMVHYNTVEEVQKLIEVFETIL